MRYNYYTPSADWGQRSGVYIFRPNEQVHNQIPKYATPTRYSILFGKVVTQIVVTWGENVFTRMSIFDDLSNIQIESLITDPSYYREAEIVMILETDIQNGDTFYTDSNGMEMQRRKLNYRETWNWTPEEPISSNYYPITSSMYIEDIVTGKRATYALIDFSPSNLSF